MASGPPSSLFIAEVVVVVVVEGEEEEEGEEHHLLALEEVVDHHLTVELQRMALPLWTRTQLDQAFWKMVIVTKGRGTLASRAILITIKTATIIKIMSPRHRSYTQLLHPYLPNNLPCLICQVMMTMMMTTQKSLWDIPEHPSVCIGVIASGNK